MVQDAAVLTQTGTALEQEASVISLEQQRLESQRAEIETREQETARKKAEAEKAKQQLEIIKRMGGRTELYEPFAKQAQERYLTAAREQQAAVPGYNTAAEQFNARVEAYRGQAEGYNKEVGEYNQQQEEFGGYLEKVAEGKDLPQTVNIGFSNRPGTNEPVFSYQATSDIATPGKSITISGSAYLSALGPTDFEGFKKWAVEGAKKQWGLGPEDVIIVEGKTVQQSSFTPEQWTIARSIATGRQEALEKYKREAELEQERLKTEWLASGRGSYVQPAAFAEAYKTQMGVAPSPGLTAVPKYNESQQQLVAKAAILSSPTAQHAEPEFYAAEAAKLQERTVATVEPLSAERMQFKAPVRTDEKGRIQFYGIQGAPGYQISEAARNRRLTEINAGTALQGPPNLIYTPAPSGPDFIYDPKYGFMKRADLVKSPEQKLLEEQRAKGYGKDMSEFSKTYYRGAENIAAGAEGVATRLEQDKGLPVPFIIKAPAVVAIKSYAGLQKTIGMIPGGVEVIARNPRVIVPAVGYGVVSTVKGTAEQAVSNPVQLGSDVAVASFLFGGAAEVGKGVTGVARTVVADIKRGAVIPEGKVPAFPGYVILKKRKLPDGTIVVEEKTIDLSAKEKTLEAEAKKSGGTVASVSKQGVVTLVKPKSEIKIEVIDVRPRHEPTPYYSEKGTMQGSIDVSNARMQSEYTSKHSPAKPIVEQKRILTEYFGELKTAKAVKGKTQSLVEAKQSAIILPAQKAQAITKQEAPTIQISSAILKAEAVQQPVAVAISKSLAINMQKSRQEPVVISKAITREVQKEEDKQVPVVVPRLRLTFNQEAAQVTGIEAPTITGTTAIDTTTPKEPRDFFRTTPDRPNERPPERPPRKGRKGEEKTKTLDVRIKKTKLEEKPEKKSKVNPWYPASLESVTSEEFGLGGKRARHIKSKKTSQELFGELKIKGKPIPTKAQYQRRKKK